MEQKEINYKQSKYDFLYENNKNYMNYTALSFLPPKGKEIKVTYEELHDKIFKYAVSLSRLGIKKGDKVGVCVINTPESVYLLYALDKLGATVVGLSPLGNEYKMEQDLRMTRPDIVITVDLFYPLIKNVQEELGFSSILYSPIESIKNPVFKLLYNQKQKREGNTVEKYNYLRNIVDEEIDDIVEFPRYQDNDVTDIMFTGGSTGVHKGVELSSSGLNMVVQDLNRKYEMYPGMTHFGQIPIGHMVYGKMIMHYSLCTNLNFALTLKAMPSDFYDELVRTNPHAAVGGPIHWDNLIDVDENENKRISARLKKNSLTNLKYATTGGEAAKLENILLENEALHYCGSNAKMGDGLGTTEMWSVVSVNNGKQSPESLGTPLSSIKAKIVDITTNEEILDNRKGKLYVSGPSMMLRYYQNEEETNKVIEVDVDGVRWYNTGDVVKRNENGELVYIGRIKRNFVCGVDNIYPEEIENILQKIPEIRESIVTKIPNEFKQFLPKYHISVYEDYSTERIKRIEKEICDLIIKTLGESALPGYIEYYREPLKRTENTKLDYNYYQNKDMEEYKAQKKKVKTRN